MEISNFFYGIPEYYRFRIPVRKYYRASKLVHSIFVVAIVIDDDPIQKLTAYWI
jgi:hypothetical protein